MLRGDLPTWPVRNWATENIEKGGKKNRKSEKELQPAELKIQDPQKEQEGKVVSALCYRE